MSPKDWACLKPRVVHITTHVYNGEKIFINSDLARYIKVYMFKIAINNNIDLIKIGCDYTHCHILIRQYSDQNLRKIVNKLKGISSREIRNKYNWLREQPHFWARSFYVTIYKDCNKIDKVKNYIDQQPREIHERIY